MKMRKILGILRDSYCRTIGIEYMHIQEPAAAQVDPGPGRAPARVAAARGAPADPGQAQRGRDLRDVPADQVRRPEALQPGGRRVRHRAARRGLRAGRRRRPGRGLHRHAAPRPAERAGQHRRQVLRADLPRVRGQHRSADRAGLRRREVPPRLRGQVHRAQRRHDQDLGGRQSRATSRRSTRCSRASPGPSRTSSTAAQRVPGAAGADARRRGVRRPGRGGRDAQPVASCAATAPAARSTSS